MMNVGVLYFEKEKHSGWVNGSDAKLLQLQFVWAGKVYSDKVDWYHFILTTGHSGHWLQPCPTCCWKTDAKCKRVMVRTDKHTIFYNIRLNDGHKVQTCHGIQRQTDRTCQNPNLWLSHLTRVTKVILCIGDFCWLYRRMDRWYFCLQSDNSYQGDYITAIIQQNSKRAGIDVMWC